MSNPLGINPLVTNRYVGQFINELTSMGRVKLQPSQATNMRELRLIDCFEESLGLSDKIYRARTGSSIGEFATIAEEVRELCVLLVVDHRKVERLEEWIRLFNQLEVRELIESELNR